MKKWLPFLILITAALGLSIYFYIFEQESLYIPQSSDPSIIYLEACAECHGRKGESSGMLYPALKNEDLTPDEVITTVRDGAFMMPAFSQIPDSVLQKLAEYVSAKQYLPATGQ